MTPDQRIGIHPNSRRPSRIGFAAISLLLASGCTAGADVNEQGANSNGRTKYGVETLLQGRRFAKGETVLFDKYDIRSTGFRAGPVVMAQEAAGTVNEIVNLMIVPNSRPADAEDRAAATCVFAVAQAKTKQRGTVGYEERKVDSGDLLGEAITNYANGLLNKDPNGLGTATKKCEAVADQLVSLPDQDNKKTELWQRAGGRGAYVYMAGMK